MRAPLVLAALVAASLLVPQGTGLEASSLADASAIVGYGSSSNADRCNTYVVERLPGLGTRVERDGAAVPNELLPGDVMDGGERPGGCTYGYCRAVLYFDQYVTVLGLDIGFWPPVYVACEACCTEPGTTPYCGPDEPTLLVCQCVPT